MASNSTSSLELPNEPERIVRKNQTAGSTVAAAASAVHTAIRDGDLSVLPELVGADCCNSSWRLLWEPNASGWTAVHYAVSLPNLPTKWLEWILVRASATNKQHDPFGAAVSCKDEKEFASPFFQVHTALGQSVFDIFFRSYLDPLPWQLSSEIKIRSRELKEALQAVCDNPVLLTFVRNEIRSWGTYRHELGHDVSSWAPQRLIGPVSTESPTVQRTLGFLWHLFLLGYAAMGKGTRDEFEWMELLARTGSCPSVVASVVRAIQQNEDRAEAASSLSVRLPRQDWNTDGNQRRGTRSASTSVAGPTVTNGNSLSVNSILPCRFSNSPSPLHTWAISSTHCPDEDGMLPHLLLAYPKAPLQPMRTNDGDHHGWLPLQLALAHGKSWSRVQPLLQAAPSVLRLPPLAGLPLVAWAALAPPTTLPTLRARQETAGQKGLVSLWQLLPADKRQVAIDHAVAALEREHLTTLFEILVAYPRALDDARFG